jgi:hypothetical protein
MGVSKGEAVIGTKSSSLTDERGQVPKAPNVNPELAVWVCLFSIDG